MVHGDDVASCINEPQMRPESEPRGAYTFGLSGSGDEEERQDRVPGKVDLCKHSCF